jgi:transposase
LQRLRRELSPAQRPSASSSSPARLRLGLLVGRRGEEGGVEFVEAGVQLCEEVRVAGLAEASLRGVGLIVAVTVVAEVGDIGRFENPKQLMAFLGLNPGEHSSGSKVRGRGITKSGNSSVRRLLYEAAWSYRQRPKVGAYMRQHMPADVPQEAKDIAWKAQVRLCRRYRALLGRGKKSQVAITAVARELVGFMWSIATTTCPTSRTPPEGHQAA